MPLLIRTPEEILRAEKKDLYFIRFNQKNFEKAQNELMRWLDKHIPASSYEKMAPSEHSGYISGYFGDLRIDFTEADLRTFCEQWETSEGKSLDKRFQCFIKPYKDWFDGISEYAPVRTKPCGTGLFVWWDTPSGFIYHQINQDIAREQGPEFNNHPLSPKDLWFQAVQLWPELSTLNAGELFYGHNYFDKEGVANVIYDHDALFDEIDFLPERRQALLEWFNLPPTTIFTEFRW